VQPPEQKPELYTYKVVKQSDVVTDVNEMHKAAFYISRKAGDAHILDARAAPRFNGEVPEPRPGVRAGNITGSQNMPFMELVDPESGCMKLGKDLAKIFTDKNIDTTRHIINTCGSGVTACVVDLGLRLVGAEDSVIYDGSWTEYGAIDEPNFDNNDWDTPIPELMEKLLKKASQEDRERSWHT